MSELEVKREYTRDERDKMAGQGIALPDGSYPIKDRHDLKNAVQAFGRNPTARVKAHITRRARSLGATDMLPPDWPGSTSEEKSVDTVLIFGGAVKALGNGKVGGYLVQYGDETKTDLEGDFFTSGTDFDTDFPGATTVYYNHALDANLKGRKLGSGEMTTDEVGVWVAAQLELRDRYEKAIYKMAEDGKLGWSSGTASHLVERKSNGLAQQIVRWPLKLDASLTPTPAEPRNAAIALKSWAAEFSTEEDDIATPIKAASSIDTERQFEEFLRDAGFSKREARAITTHGYKAISRWDADEDASDTQRQFQTRLRILEAQLKAGVNLDANLTTVSAQGAGTGD